MKKRKTKFLIILYFVLGVMLKGQDTQYWSKQYGTYGELLGNIVIGAISDLSSTYYNPGATAFTRDSSLILTTSSFQFIYLNYNNIFNSDLNIDSWYTNASQGIFAIRLPFHLADDDQIVGSFLTRQDFKFNSNGRSEIPVYNKVQYKSDLFSIDQELSEYWFGLTWSKSVSERIGLGVTTYLAYRTQNMIKQLILQNYSEFDGTENFIARNDLNYNNLRLLWKVGISYQIGKLMVGASLTSPSINIFGNGNVAMLVSNNYSDSLTNEIPGFISNSQEDLDAYFKSPLSIGFGFAYYWTNTVLYFSAEWFDKVKNFSIMNPNEFIAQSSGERISHNVNFSMKSVLNLGIGIKYIFNKNFIYYGGISSDKSAHNPESLNPFILSTWDIINVRSGAEFKFLNLSITLGFNYGFSGQLFGNFNLLGIFKNSATDVIYHQIDVILGLTYSM